MRMSVLALEGATLYLTMQISRTAKLIEFVFMKRQLCIADMVRLLQESSPFVDDGDKRSFSTGGIVVSSSTSTQMRSTTFLCSRMIKERNSQHGAE